jgi:uncharacterized membrane protein YuzA (DUF378 family)
VKNLNALDWIALILVVVGGLNWGLVGIFGFDLVAWVFASVYIIARIVYILVAVAAIYMIIIAAMLRRK